DRAIVLPMRRRAPGETVERIRRDGLLRRLDPLRRRAARWVADHLAALQAADPAVPAALNDRQADNWRPLLAIADAAGGGGGSPRARSPEPVSRRPRRRLWSCWPICRPSSPRPPPTSWLRPPSFAT